MGVPLSFLPAQEDKSFEQLFQWQTKPCAPPRKRSQPSDDLAVNSPLALPALTHKETPASRQSFYLRS